MIKFIFILFLPIWVCCQGTFKATNGINIVSTNDPIINLHNTDLYNGTSLTDLGAGTIWGITGNIPQTISGTYISSLYGLRLNNSNGFVLQANTTISNRLDMVDGNILVGDYNIEVGTSTINPGQINWTSGTIIGPLKRWFAPSTNLTQSSGIFPIGNNSTNRNVIINYTQAPTEGGYIIVEYKNGIPSMPDNYSGLPLWTSDGQLIQNYEDAGYFEISPDNNTSSLNTKQYKLTMRANNLENMNDRSIVRLIKSPGPDHNTWVACGTHSSINGTSNSDFTVTSINVVGFSWFNFGSQNNNPLPVELTEFNGVAYPQYNLVKWITASEHNSDYFKLESSIDGLNWRSIAIQEAAQNSTQEINYSFMDYDLSKVVYYKLIQYDTDGAFKEYGPISVIRSLDKKKIVMYVNLLGQLVDPYSFKGLMFEVYEDGSTRKIIK